MDDTIICNFCSKTFSCRISLLRHQKTVKSCLKLQGKEETDIECENCKKILSIKYYKQHKVKCDIIFEKTKKNQEEYENKNKDMYEKNKNIEKQNNILLEENKNLKLLNEKLNEQLILELKEKDKLKGEIIEYKTTIIHLKEQTSLLKEQNEKLQSISTSVTMKLAEKVNTVNNNHNHNKIIINNIPLTNEVLRQCANTFTIDNAYNINGITKHLTSSLKDHITCTDPSRNVFKYTNEKDEEIVDQDLEILLPQYLTAVKDRNNFLYKEVFEYFKKNNVSLNEQTDYKVFYQALNNIIEKTGQQNKYTEKCKQYMVRECKRQFLEKNKKKEKTLTKELTDDEIMMNIIETGGTLYDFLNRFFPDYDFDGETDEQFTHRREMEDIFRQKKREYKEEKEKENKEEII
jgi:hypothetical protein